MSTPPTDIPEKAARLAAETFHFNDPNESRPWSMLPEKARAARVRRAQAALSAALPIVLASRDEEYADLVAEVRQKDRELEEWRTGVLRLSASRDSETAEPELIMGTKPDGSPWVVSAEFDGPTVRVDGYGALRLHGKAISPRTAYKLATGLLAAITWVENDGAAKAEAAGQAAAFTCPGHSMPQPADAPPEGYVACYRAGHECSSTTTRTEDEHGGLSTRAVCPCCGDGHGSSYVPASLRGEQP